MTVGHPPLAVARSETLNEYQRVPQLAVPFVLTEIVMPRFLLRWAVVTAVAATTADPTYAQQDAEPISRIAFGSCVDQDKPVPIFDTIADAEPELLLMLGDNIYADIKTPRAKVDPTVIENCYATLAAIPGWQRIRKACPVLAVWDDHDYGINDAGVEWKFKDESKAILLDFFDVPADSPRRTRDGVYGAAVFGPPGQRVQVILLDTRYFRSPLTRADRPLPGQRVPPYISNTADDATVLGADQWKWLETQLREPAEVRLLCSSIQVVPDEHVYEKWGNFPNERAKLFDLIRDTRASGVIVLSGDRHHADLSVETKAVGYPLFDATSSGMNQAASAWRAPEPNRYRVGGMAWGNNFGMVEIDWSKPDPLVSLKLLDANGKTGTRETIPLSLLTAKAEVPPKVALPEGAIGARDALKKKPGESVVLQYEVQAARKTPARFFLNSDKDFRSEDNFTVLIVGKALTEGKWADATEETFKGKTIRVNGVLSEYDGRPQLQVDDETKLEIVGE